MKDRREEERDQPCHREAQQDLDRHWPVAIGEDAAVQAQDGQFDEAQGEQVPELQDEEELVADVSTGSSCSTAPD